RRIDTADRQPLWAPAYTRGPPRPQVPAEPGRRMRVDAERLHREGGERGALAGVEPLLSAQDHLLDVGRVDEHDSFIGRGRVGERCTAGEIEPARVAAEEPADPLPTANGH